MYSENTKKKDGLGQSVLELCNLLRRISIYLNGISIASDIPYRSIHTQNSLILPGEFSRTLEQTGDRVHLIFNLI